MNIEWFKGEDDKLWHKTVEKEQGRRYFAGSEVESACGVFQAASEVSFVGDQEGPKTARALACPHCGEIEVEV